MDRKSHYEKGLLILFRNGLRLTGQRKRMLALIVQARRPQTAMELYEKMQGSFPGLSYGTVYQNIKIFLRLQLIESTLLGNEVRYRAVDHMQPQFQFHTK